MPFDKQAMRKTNHLKVHEHIYRSMNHGMSYSIHPHPEVSENICLKTVISHERVSFLTRLIQFLTRLIQKD
jgi:hypothetical protein